MRQIEHNTQEPAIDRSSRIYWFAFIGLAALWVANLALLEINWTSVCLGLFTGVVIAVWGIETTDNEPPRWLLPRDSYWARRARKEPRQ